jgi:hypothetical protein
MIGGTSRLDEGCRLPLVAVIGLVEEDRDVEVEGDEEAEALDVSFVVLGFWKVVSLSSSVAAELLVAFGFGDAPSRLSISSRRRPLDSKKDALRSSGASRNDSSCKNLAACCRRADREVSSKLGEDEEAELLELVAEGCCHWGIEGGLGLESVIMLNCE